MYSGRVGAWVRGWMWGEKVSSYDIASMSKVVPFVPISPPTTFFTFNVIGANVGAVSVGNRAALKRRASNKSNGTPCCFKLNKVVSTTT